MGTNSTEQAAAGIDFGSEITEAEWPRQQTQGSKMPLWAPIGVVFALAAVASFYLPIFAERPGPPAAPSGLARESHSSAAGTTVPAIATLGMRALRQTDTVLISWDPKAVAATSATEGFLDVQDGTEEKHLRLDTNQISTGLMSYDAHAPDLLLRLEFRNQQGPVMSQSMTLLGDSLDPKSLLPASTVAEHVATAPAGITGSTVRQPILAGRKGSKDLNPKPVREISTSSSKTVSDPPDGATPMQGGFESTPPSPQAPAVPSLNAPAYDAPVLSASIPSSMVQANETIDRLTPKPSLVQLPPAALQPKTETVQHATVATPPKAIALDPNAGNYTPPRPLKWGPPSARKAKISLAAPVDVALKIRIDEFGRVIKVHPLSEGQKTSKELMKLADASVRRWVFEPARYKGKAIASEDTIVLRIEK